ncbi:MAG: YdbC family protein [Chloroflexota bacterium]
MPDIQYEIRAHLGALSRSASGWQKELNLVSWNEREPKYDLRDWSPDHQKMGKGVTLTREELLALKTLLNGIEI